jgi:hypothetical protein
MIPESRDLNLVSALHGADAPLLARGFARCFFRVAFASTAYLVDNRKTHLAQFLSLLGLGLAHGPRVRTLFRSPNMRGLIAACVCASAVAFAPVNAPARSTVVMSAEMSKALPFLKQPPLLDGTMAGDAGFDPLGLSQIDDVGIDLYWLREAELKHSRCDMAGVEWRVAVGAVSFLIATRHP